MEPAQRHPPWRQGSFFSDTEAPCQKLRREPYRGNPERKAESPQGERRNVPNDMEIERDRSRLGIRLDQPDSHRESDQPRHIVNFKPFHQLTSVCFNGFHAQVQAVRDVFRGLAFRDQL